jgi:hypothetical protein
VPTTNAGQEEKIVMVGKIVIAADRHCYRRFVAR